MSARQPGDRAGRDEDARVAAEADAAARHAAQTIFDHPIVLEAGAGTGKTSTLVARALAWSVGPGWERHASRLGADADPGSIAAATFERVIAITFTDKAAAEMARRVGEGLAALHEGRPVEGLEPASLPADAILRTRAAALLCALDRLAAGTIHSFCHRLLGRFPFEAGLHPGFEVDPEGEIVDSVVREVLDERIPELYGDPGDPDALMLAAAGHGPGELAGHLAALISTDVPASALEDEFAGLPRVRAVAGRLARLARDLRELVGDSVAVGNRYLDKARTLMSALETLLADLERLDAPDRLWEAIERFPADAWSKLGAWATKVPATNESGALGPSRIALLKPAAQQLLAALEQIRDVDVVFLQCSARLLARLLAEVSARAGRRGAISFNGLLVRAHRLLASSPDVLETVRQEIDQLLLDEVQDTDPEQYAIVERIAFPDPAGGDGARPGLLLAGDPKQLIYGFRDADLGAYESFVTRVCAEGGAVHSLCVNFRSVPAILDEVEAAVAPRMTPSPGVQPAFERLVPCAALASNPGCTQGGRAPVEYWVAWDRTVADFAKTSASRARDIEAQAVARDIAALHGADGSWNQAAVLLRNTGPIDVYLQALREAGVPYAVERDRSYYRRREILDTSALVRLLDDPNDQLALVAFLRAPWVGVPDAAIVPLWRRDLPGLVRDLLSGGDTADRARFRLAETIPDVAAELAASSAPGIERIAAWPATAVSAFTTLARLHASFHEEPADRFVERLRATTLIEETEAARFLGPHRLANLERFFNRLTLALTDGQPGLEAFLREVRSGAIGGREDEEGSAGDETLPAVRVLTIHKAKGLTFDHVYFVNTHAGHRTRDRIGPVAVRFDGRWEFCLFGTATLGLGPYVARRRAHANAEEVRTLYVALTRPRFRLVISGGWPAGGKTPPATPRHVDLLAGRTRGVPDLEGAALAAGAPDVEYAVSVTEGEAGDGARWVLLGAGGAPVTPRRTAGGDAGPFEPGDDAARLAAARATARVRMGRPLLASASSAAHEEIEKLLAQGGHGDFVQGEADREIAFAVGTAVHRVLEAFDLEAPRDEELDRQRALVPTYLAPRLAPDLVAAAGARTMELLDKLRDGGLLDRLRSIAGAIVGREWPLLVAPGAGSRGKDEAVPRPSRNEPVGAYVGIVDLLYIDPETAAPVIVDYKTDPVETDEAIAARAAAYALQGQVYLDAVAAAFAGSGRPAPRFELWFVHPGRIVRVP